MTADQSLDAKTLADQGVIAIHGKLYKTVARRVADFRDFERFQDYRLTTEVLHADTDSVLVKATIYDADNKVASTGHGEENRTSGVNRTSALENAETSAVGRALAFLDKELQGTEIASADEIAEALTQQVALDSEAIRKEEHKYMAEHMRAVLDNLDSVLTIKRGIAEGQFDVAKESWIELGEENMRALWRAPTKGGVFTTKEREVMKSPEWREA